MLNPARHALPGHHGTAVAIMGLVRVSISEGIIDNAFNVMLLVQCYGRT